MEEEKKAKSVQENSPSGEFLQSNEWLMFQESVGRKTFNLAGKNFSANIIEHRLPIAGKYLYIPKGPIFSCNMQHITCSIDELIKLAKENKAGWIRIELETEEILEIVRKNIDYKIVKAPHDVQPKEIFVIDISKSEDELLAEMKPKTRYNVKLAEKRGVIVSSGQRTVTSKNVDEFLRLTQVMAKRQGIVAHPAEYYRKMIENISGDILKLYVAEYEGRVIAANLVVFFGEACVYLHGASDDDYRNVMAPYLLQWQQIQDAKEAGCVRYDFGGVSAINWQGITKFKLGFSPKTMPTIFPGSYDIVISMTKYRLYRSIQRLRRLRRD
jgi:lipid II:glycine glycyltransferase (peptidoglycan interpeptide bridge formation enzyme)